MNSKNIIPEEVKIVIILTTRNQYYNSFQKCIYSIHILRMGLEERDIQALRFLHDFRAIPAVFSKLNPLNVAGSQ